MAKNKTTNKPSIGDKPIKASAGGYNPNVMSGYDGAINRGRRRQVYINNRSDDHLLRRIDRDTLISNARSLKRNASIVAWGVRKHVNLVANFTFQARTGDKALDDEIESLVNWWARPLNCDVEGRHDLYKLIRLIESSKITDGDILVYKLADGRVQLIEADRVRTPSNVSEFNKSYPASIVDPADFIHGVRVDQYGKALAYAICDRDANGQYTLSQLVSAADVFFYGNIERPGTIRGVSRLAPAINTFRDLYEACEYALQKMKLSQIVGLKFTRGGNTIDVDGFDDDVDGQGTSPSHPSDAGYKFDFGGGPQAIDLEPGDDAQFMSIATPSNEFQAFVERSAAEGLKAVDIPYSFYDESFTNYSGARQALTMYEQMADQTRDELRILLHAITVWRLSLFIADGHLMLPDGMTMDDINFKWIGAPLPWIDPQKEAIANKVLVDNKFSSRQRICAERGIDWFEVMDEQAAEEAYAAKLGVSLLDIPAVTAKEDVVADNEPDPLDPKADKEIDPTDQQNNKKEAA